MTYKNYLVVGAVRNLETPDVPSTSEKFEAFDTDDTDHVSTFENTGVPYSEHDSKNGVNIPKPIHTFDPSDAATAKTFQDAFLAADDGKYKDYPTKEIGNYYSADIINVVRRMVDPTGNRFTIPVPAELKGAFTQIFQGSIVGRPVQYAGVQQFRFELDFDAEPSYDQVIQLRTFMTLIEDKYSARKGMKVTTGQVSADEIAAELGPDMATLYDFALENTEAVFDSKMPLSAEMPEVKGAIVGEYLHAKQTVAADQPLNADGFFTGALDGYGPDAAYVSQALGVTSLTNISEATLTYEFFEKALELNDKSMNAAEAGLWDLDDAEKAELATVLADFNKAIYVQFSWPINNAEGVEVARGTGFGVYEPVSGYKTAFGAPIPSNLPLDDTAKAAMGSSWKDAQATFDEYLMARGFVTDEE